MSRGGDQGRLAGLRIGLVTAAASRLGGGVFEAVAAQAEMIRAAGGEAPVFALDDAFSAEDAGRFAPSPVITARVLGPGQVGFAPRLADQLVAARLDCLHLHGIWMYPTRAATLWARQTGRPLLISPHGMLDPWITARGRWKKALARAGYERASWRQASRLHALTGTEGQAILAETGRGDSLVIPNPGPAPGPFRAAPRADEVLYLGRIHPKKNLAALIDAWELLAAARALPLGARLTIAGWGTAGDVAALEARLQGAPPSIRFVGPCFGDAKAARLAAARYLVLPSLSEGLPMAVLEAWAAGMPVLMSAACNLPEGFAAGAALECGTRAETIAACLLRALGLGHGEWLGMARAAAGLAVKRFAPGVISAQWAEIYAGLIAANRAANHPAAPRTAHDPA